MKAPTLQIVQSEEEMAVESRKCHPRTVAPEGPFENFQSPPAPTPILTLLLNDSVREDLRHARDHSGHRRGLTGGSGDHGAVDRCSSRSVRGAVEGCSREGVVAVKRPMVLRVVTATMLLAPLIVTGQARAEVPGVNGQIAFERLAPNQAFEAPGNGTVFVANPDGTHPQQVPLVYPTDVVTGIDWSPDGTKLLLQYTIRFDKNGDCCLPFRPAIVNADGSGFRLLTMKYAPHEAGCAVWMPDQKRLVCFFGGDTPGVFNVRASDGGDPVRLTTYPFGSDCNSCDMPTDVSPDGTRFVFLRYRRETAPGGQQVAIYVENIDGTGLRQLTPYGYAAPHEIASAQWSPDGTQIISETTAGGLFTVRPDGTDRRQINLQVGTGSYFASWPHWSPDGTRIVFRMFINGTEGIYTANPDGSNVVRVTDAPTGFDAAPDWGTHPLAT